MITERLLARTARLVDVPSVSRDESAVLDLLAAELPSTAHEVVRADGVVALLPHRREGAPLVLLAGHVDTVPAQGENTKAVRDGDRLSGLGTTDMKGAIAVMWELLESPPSTAADIGVVLFGREEIPITESALLPFLQTESRLADTALAIVMEPTDNSVQLGCMGNLNATVRYHGEAAHSARPWLGANAIHAAIAGLAGVSARAQREVVEGGLPFREVANVTMIQGGVANNIIPDEVTAHLNLRYAPGRDPGSAERELRELVGPDAIVQIISDAPSGPIPKGNPLVAMLADVVGIPGPKQAWTPVAEFGLVGIDAVNFGPGEPDLAHRPDESVTGAALATCLELLTRFLQAVEAG